MTGGTMGASSHTGICLLPKISAHALRHTGCTRVAEQRSDIKVLQYIMGHANLDVTMNVYNHITDKARFERDCQTEYGCGVSGCRIGVSGRKLNVLKVLEPVKPVFIGLHKIFIIKLALDA